MEHRQEDGITSCSTPMRAKSAALAARATDAHRLQNCEMTMFAACCALLVRPVLCLLAPALAWNTGEKMASHAAPHQSVPMSVALASRRTHISG